MESHSRERVEKGCNCMSTTMPISLDDLIQSNRKELVSTCNLVFL